MVDNTLQLLFAHPMHQLPSSNRVMVDDLTRSGALRSQECVSAFEAVDRQHFWLQGSGDLVYADMPLRNGRLHLSAPQIYAEALESLMPLTPGLSFLNVGSGTGYFNSLVSELIGKDSTNHGIDIWPETLQHAYERCGAIGKRGIEFFLGNVYQLNVNRTMRYDRIYLGACANSRSKYLYRLLEVGGTLVGPFQAGRTQQLRRVVRQTETRFSVEVLESVRFASLVEPAPVLNSSPMGESGAATPRGSEAQGLPGAPRSRTLVEQQVGLPGVPFTFSLCERPWSPLRARLYPESFRKVVKCLLLCSHRDEAMLPLPIEIWTQHVFPWCTRAWFGEPKPEFAFSPQARGIAGKAGPDDEYLSDDGGSTRAPSASTTPESGPGEPPESMAALDQAPLDLGNVLFEVFGNGQHHAIGAEGDPDDLEMDDGPRQVLPLQVLQLLAASARTRREHDEDERDEEELESDEEREDDDQEFDHGDDEIEEEGEDDDDEMMFAEDFLEADGPEGDRESLGAVDSDVEMGAENDGPQEIEEPVTHQRLRVGPVA